MFFTELSMVIYYKSLSEIDGKNVTASKKKKKQTIVLADYFLAFEYCSYVSQIG